MWRINGLSQCILCDLIANNDVKKLIVVVPMCTMGSHCLSTIDMASSVLNIVLVFYCIECDVYMCSTQHVTPSAASGNANVREIN